MRVEHHASTQCGAFYSAVSWAKVRGNLVVVLTELTRHQGIRVGRVETSEETGICPSGDMQRITHPSTSSWSQIDGHNGVTSYCSDVVRIGAIGQVGQNG